MIVHADCVEHMARMDPCSIDAIVTDPPYGLEFMGKDWDRFGRGEAASRATATRAARGGHPATDGRPTFLGGLNPRCRACGRSQRGGSPCRCETPDFTDERGPRMRAFQAWCETWAAEALRVLKPGGHLLAFGGTRTYHRMTCAIEDAGFEVRDSIAWLYGSGFPKSLDVSKAIDKRPGIGTGNGATDAARTWQGWGTALKPAHEPIVLARKPLTGTVAANVLEHGTGALNIDGCRIPTDGEQISTPQSDPAKREGVVGAEHTYSRLDREEMNRRRREAVERANDLGRWPANVVLDPASAAQLDEQTGTLTSGRFEPHHADSGKDAGRYGAMPGRERDAATYGDSGGASRFFYTAKASKAARGEGNTHPTVKPVELMRWLVRLVTPPGGTVLDPFAGSGTTLIACVIEGFDCIGIEREAEYVEIIRRRLAQPIEPVLFGGAA